MSRRFNTGGPCQADVHYMLPPERRLQHVVELVESRQYFVLHAPRQVGKTTALLTLAKRLTADGAFAAILLSAEEGAPFPDKPQIAEARLIEAWRRAAVDWLPAGLRPPDGPTTTVGGFLGEWARACPRPLVVFLDEIDALSGATLLVVLRQIRAGFPARPHGFPQSIGLCGMRDVRDYKTDAGGSGRLDTSSPFNIKSESLTLRSFLRDEVAELYAQHTADTGQRFTDEAVDRAFFLTRGQPWLVNALARELVERLVPDRDVAITAADVDRARDRLILRQDTHLDSLAERLREDRVRGVVSPILAGSYPESALPPDDVQYAIDLGLVVRGNGLEIANPIYREVVPRVLAAPAADVLSLPRPTWSRPDGGLDEEALLQAFSAFWRQNGDALAATVAYPEIAPHLVLMAFLHRIVNGGGTIEREYAIGTGRMDLCVRLAGTTIGIEIKRWRDRDADPTDDGLSQIDGYLAGLGLDRGWLVVFDQRTRREALAKRTAIERRRSPEGRDITLLRG